MTAAPRPVVPLALSRSPASLPYLSLGMVAAFLRREADSGRLPGYAVGEVRLAGVEGRPLREVYADVERLECPVVLLSSYVWNHELNMQAAAEIKRRNPAATIVVGGPEIPKWPLESEAFLCANPAVDVAVLGEGEVACAELLARLPGVEAGQSGLEGVAGIVYRWQGRAHRSPDRQRVRDLDQLPSPYLSGEFDSWIDNVPMATLETNRGCPYGCTYCDWGSATLQKVSRFDLQRVVDEVDYLARHRMEEIFIADANFGMLEQDIAIAAALVAARKEHGYPRRLFTNFAKNGGRRLMEVIEILNRGGLLPTGIVALQTTDPDTLRTIRRDNIRTASYEKMMEFFNARGIPMASDLMIGLPGQTLASFHEDLQFCFDWKISANGNYTSMMPNAPMAEPAYMAQHAIETDQYSMITSSATFTAAELLQMRRLYLAYQLLVRMALLKYLLYYLQIDHGVPAIGFIARWLELAMEQGGSYPMSGSVYARVIEPASRRGHWPQVTWGEDGEFLFRHLDTFYEEALAVAGREFGISVAEEERRALFAAQAAVMPNKGADYPLRVALPLDVPAYFEQLRPLATLRREGLALAPLSSFGPGELVAGEAGTRVDSIAMQQLMGHSDLGWELPSPLRFY